MSSLFFHIPQNSYSRTGRNTFLLPPKRLVSANARFNFERSDSKRPMISNRLFPLICFAFIVPLRVYGIPTTYQIPLSEPKCKWIFAKGSLGSDLIIEICEIEPDAVGRSLGLL